MTVASAALLLFLILDPLGNIPVFLGLLKSLPWEAASSSMSKLFQT